MPIPTGCIPEIIAGCSAGSPAKPILTGCSAGLITVGRSVGTMVSSMVWTHHESIQMKSPRQGIQMKSPRKHDIQVHMQPGNLPLGVFPVCESECESEHCKACQGMRQQMIDNGAKILKLTKESRNLHELLDVQRAKLDEKDRQIKSMTNLDNAKILELLEFQKMLLEEKDREIQSLTEEVRSLQAPAQIFTTGTLVEKVDANNSVKDKGLVMEQLSPLKQTQIFGA